MDLDFLNYRKQGNFNNVLIGFIIHQSMKYLTFGFSDNLHFHWLFNKSTKYETAFCVCCVQNSRVRSSLSVSCLELQKDSEKLSCILLLPVPFVMGDSVVTF